MIRVVRVKFWCFGAQIGIWSEIWLDFRNQWAKKLLFQYIIRCSKSGQFCLLEEMNFGFRIRDWRQIRNLARLFFKRHLSSLQSRPFVGFVFKIRVPKIPIVIFCSVFSVNCIDRIEWEKSLIWVLNWDRIKTLVGFLESTSQETSILKFNFFSEVNLASCKRGKS